jgi:fermentation-respiration switch protein FrsA (DUF1100 family)
VREEAVEFRSGGVTLRGIFAIPAGDGPFPAVVMGGGWLYVKEFNQPTYAQAFAERGIASLRFDYRCLGESDGEPRQHINSWWQIEDLRNGLSFLENRDEVDRERLGVWGISFGGGLALIVGALDQRVKCVVSNVPVCDGFEGIRRIHGTKRFRAFRKAILEDRRSRYVTGEYGTNKFAEDSDEVVNVPLDEVKEVFEQVKATMAPNIEMYQTLASQESLLEFTVFPYVHRLVETPVLMTVAEGDDVTWVDLETRAFNEIPCPRKQLRQLPSGVTHSTFYRDRTPIDVSAAWAADWFVEHLIDTFATDLDPATT